MRKVLLFLTILTVAVLCSACINNYAVQQLNEIAKKYADHGDLNAAVARLESSVDLDGNIYESRYNLAVAYMDINECEKALEQIKIAKTLIKKEDPTAYYVEAIANSCLAYQIYNNKHEDGTVEPIEYEGVLEQVKMATKYVGYLKEANYAYDKYLKSSSINEKTDDILNIINENNEKINEYSEKYNLL